MRTLAPRRVRAAPVFAFVLGLVLAGCNSSGSRGPAVRYDARTFFETVSINGASFSPDASKILFNSDESGVFNAYWIPREGGAPTKLTDSTTDATYGESYFPHDERILLRRNHGGNELDHLYVRELDGSERDLTPGDTLKASFAGWSKDGAAFYVASNERDPRYFDLYRYATDGYARTLFFQNEEGYDLGSVSLDGRWLALVKSHDNSNDDVLLWDSSRPSERPVVVTPHEGAVAHADTSFTPDGRKLFYLSDEQSEFQRLWSRDLESGETKLALEAPWDLQFVSFSRDGHYRVTGVNADAHTEITVLDRKRNVPVALPKLPALDIQGVEISEDGRWMAFHASGDTSPTNLYVMDLEGGEHQRLTNTLNPAMNEEELVRGESVRFKSFDGVEIPSLLYRPHGATKSAPVPAMLWMHGGPGGQSRSGYNPVVQHLVNHGIAVLAVNNRGSSGYGKTFFHLDDRKHGEADLDDCVWAKKYLAQEDWIDGEHIGILGGSYGGYLVAAALAFRPDEFAVGIDIFGVTNWVRTLESIPAWWGSRRDSLFAEIGDPMRDSARLEKISPLFHSKRIKKPLLVIQGKNDPRVLQRESDELVEAARANGAPVEYIVFDDEGHGFVNKENRIRASEAYLAFLEKHLR